MNICQIIKDDIANGMGIRLSLFVSGCTRKCPGCFNREAWDFSCGRKLDEALLEEILAVAEAEGVTGLREITTATNYWPEDNPMYRHVPSTAQDVRAQRKTEIDFLNGTIVRLGKKHGIPTPYNSMVTNLIHIIENNYDAMF